LRVNLTRNHTTKQPLKTKTEPEPIQTDRFWFVILEQKQVQTGSARFFFGFLGLISFLVFLLTPN